MRLKHPGITSLNTYGIPNVTITQSDSPVLETEESQHFGAINAIGDLEFVTFVLDGGSWHKKEEVSLHIWVDPYMKCRLNILDVINLKIEGVPTNDLIVNGAKIEILPKLENTP